MLLEGGKESPSGYHESKGDGRAKGLGGSSKDLEDEFT